MRSVTRVNKLINHNKRLAIQYEKYFFLTLFMSHLTYMQVTFDFHIEHKPFTERYGFERF